MLTINQTDILLSQVAKTKTEAIQSVAISLTEKGYIKPDYLKGMLAREQQSSTYLGNGIAIPHGTIDTRNMVINTGFIVHHYPQGVDWGDGNTIYLAIGIAAKSDEHLAILTQLTKVLSNEGVENLLKNATQADTIVSLLSTESQSETLFDEELLQLNFPVNDLSQLSAIAAGLIKNKGAVNNSFISDAINNLVYLGQGLCITMSNKGVIRTALSFVTTSTPLSIDGQPVRGLLCLASNNELHFKNLNYLINILYQNKIELLFNTSEKEIIRLLTQQALVGTQEIFTIKNPHGLHTRPSALLVNTAKKFKSSIQMANLDGTGKAETVKNLMKVMGQDIKFGHRVQFTAQGDDADAAIIAIGKAINEGLGEGLDEGLDESLDENLAE